MSREMTFFRFLKQVLPEGESLFDSILIGMTRAALVVLFFVCMIVLIIPPKRGAPSERDRLAHLSAFCDGEQKTSLWNLRIAVQIFKYSVEKGDGLSESLQIARVVACE